MSHQRWLRRLSGCLQLVLATALVASATASGGIAHAARQRASPRLVRDLSNVTPLTIPQGRQVHSSLPVIGFDTVVADVDVHIFDLGHPSPDALDLLLVGPEGQTAVILSDVGASADSVTLRLDDQAPGQVSGTGQIVDGVFQPTNMGSGDTFAPPAPANPPSGAQLGVFNSSDPNGNWTLYIRSDPGSFTGSLGGGWGLRITSANGVPDAAPERYTVKAGKALNEQGGVLQNDDDPDDDPLTAILAGRPGKGQVQLQPDGSFTFRTRKKAKGTDDFTYLAQDPGGLSELETVTIKIKKAKKKRRRQARRGRSRSRR